MKHDERFWYCSCDECGQSKILYLYVCGIVKHIVLSREQSLRREDNLKSINRRPRSTAPPTHQVSPLSSHHHRHHHHQGRHHRHHHLHGRHHHDDIYAVVFMMKTGEFGWLTCWLVLTRQQESYWQSLQRKREWIKQANRSQILP